MKQETRFFVFKTLEVHFKIQRIYFIIYMYLHFSMREPTVPKNETMQLIPEYALKKFTHMHLNINKQE